MTFRCSSKSRCDKNDCRLCHKSYNCLYCANAAFCSHRSTEARLHTPHCYTPFPGRTFGGNA